jgi:FKBP-type peptidyl-prolyl cis-trans isomerase
MTCKMLIRVVVIIGIFAGQVLAEDALTGTERLNYALGVETAKNLKRQGVEVNLDMMVKGLKDGLSGGTLLMTDKDLQKTLEGFQNESRLKVRQGRRSAGEDEKNRKEGEAFLGANKTKEGVVTLPSGLQYKVLKAGSGRIPRDEDTVRCLYMGAFINGTEFDNTFRSKRPVAFKMSEVMPGLREALKLMPVGSKWQLFVPSELAYGEKGSGTKIGPNATLIFEVELLGIR